jgi:hypothetical protein
MSIPLNSLTRRDLLNKCTGDIDDIFRSIILSMNTGNYRIDVVRFMGDDAYSSTAFNKFKAFIYQKISTAEDLANKLINEYPDDNLIKSELSLKMQNKISGLTKMFEFLEDGSDFDPVLISYRKEMTDDLEKMINQSFGSAEAREQPSNNNTPVKVAETFKSLFKTPNDKFIDAIIEKNKGSKPKQLAFLLRALVADGHIYDEINQSEVVRIFKNEFAFTGEYSSINYYNTVLTNKNLDILTSTQKKEVGRFRAENKKLLDNCD